ncbi:aminotransferase class V-fold PLP-dependent enzyme [Francisella tularensis]|nr:aminotransferase class V-fold PLP-dependent enzyme [Francisella tularensis]
MLREGLIGSQAKVDGPFGLKDLVYADYVASGRALKQVEHFILEDVLPYYANSHTEASYCGGMMTRLRRAARAVIAECCDADHNHAVIFAGSGATAGINRLVNLLGVSKAVASGQRVCVIIGPYEHHSNIRVFSCCRYEHNSLSRGLSHPRKRRLVQTRFDHCHRSCRI